MYYLSSSTFYAAECRWDSSAIMTPSFVPLRSMTFSDYFHLSFMWKNMFDINITSELMSTFISVRLDFDEKAKMMLSCIFAEQVFSKVLSFMATFFPQLFRCRITHLTKLQLYSFFLILFVHFCRTCIKLFKNFLEENDFLVKFSYEFHEIWMFFL